MRNSHQNTHNRNTSDTTRRKRSGATPVQTRESHKPSITDPTKKLVYRRNTGR